MTGRISKTVHLNSAARFGKFTELAPDLKYKTPDGSEPYALGFQDADGETHVFVVTDAAKKALVAAMTGIEVARAMPT